MNRDENNDATGRASPDIFTATHWSVVLQAKAESREALSVLCQSYRQPLVVWLLSRRWRPDEVEDLVQGFFLHLLTRDFLGHVTQKKGKFRTFLLTALRRFLADEFDRRRAQKRGEGISPASLQETDESGRIRHDPAALEAAPDQAYDRAWAQTVLANALRRLEQECARSGHAALCARLLPVLFADETALPYRQIGAQLGLAEGAVKVAAHRLRARLKGLVRDEVRQTVRDETEWGDEVKYLVRLFGR